MRICIVATSGISLINFRGKLIQEWVKLGHDVVCVSIEPKEEMQKDIAILGASYYQVAGTRTGISLASGFRMIADYKKAFTELRPDLVFLYMGKPVAFGGIAAIQTHVPRIIVFVTGLEMAFYSTGVKNFVIRTVLKIMFRYVHSHAETIFFMCKEDREKMIKWHLVDREKTAYVDGSGVDMTHFCKTPIPDDVVVCMTARLVWSKGIREYIEAAKIIKRDRPDLKIRFTLAGGLDENDEALSKIELDEIVAEGVIDYYGFRDDVYPCLQECSIFVLPSYHEGKGKSILEAQAVGRPIITTTAPGCSETVVDGYNGYKVPPRDARALAQKIICLAENPEMRAKMGENAYDYCKKTFDVNIINRVFLEKMRMV